MTDVNTRPGVRGATRLLLEAVVIVVSILLAFSIDAWWDGVQDRGRTAAQRETLRHQIDGNVVSLRADSVRVAAASFAEHALIELITPDPQSVPADSLATLLSSTFSAEIRPLELGALEAIITSGEFADSDPTLAALLVEFRRNAARLAEAGAARLDLREELITYLGSRVSVAFVSTRTGAHPPSDFPVPVRAILSDAGLEGRVGNIAVRTLVLRSQIRALQELAAAIKGHLDAMGGAS